MPHYVIFGDSIGCGEGAPEKGWAKLLGDQYPVKNSSIDGSTTANYVKNFPQDITKNSTLIIALGVNDSVRISLKEFQENLIQLIKLAKKYTQKIIFVGPAPVDQSKTDPAPWAPELSYQTNLVKQYNTAMKQLAEQENLTFVDLFNDLPPEYIQTLVDGLHPNAAGHKMIYDVVKYSLMLVH